MNDHSVWDIANIMTDQWLTDLYLAAPVQRAMPHTYKPCTIWNQWSFAPLLLLIQVVNDLSNVVVYLVSIGMTGGIAEPAGPE